MENFLPVFEHFYSIQGEGYNTGMPAYFIRLSGCSVGCAWCDTKITWSVEGGKMTSIDVIVNEVINSNSKNVVITGGEPTMHNLSVLTDSLKKNGIKTFLETSGVNKITGSWDWICISPKIQRPPLNENLLLANELKVVVGGQKYFLWAEENAEKVSPECKLFLQPEWIQHNDSTRMIIEYIKLNPKWNLSVQIHKYLRIR